MSDFSTTSESLEIQVELTPSLATVGLVGALDNVGAEELERVMRSDSVPGTTPLRLDLSRLTFVDSCGLRAVLRLYGRCLKDQRELVIVPAPEGVQRVFALTRAADVLPFAPGLVAA